MIDEKSHLNERYEHLFQSMKSRRFLDIQGLGNEVPFFICPYDPKDEVAVRRMLEQLIRRLQQEGIGILHINLFDLMVELLKERGIWDRVLRIEPTFTKDKLKETLQGVLDPEKHLIPAIGRKMAQSEFDYFDPFWSWRSLSATSDLILFSTICRAPPRTNRLYCSSPEHIPNLWKMVLRLTCSAFFTMTNTTAHSTYFTSELKNRETR